MRQHQRKSVHEVTSSGAMSVGDAAHEGPPDGATPLLRWVPIVVIGALIVSVVRRAARPIDDPDAWWHLRVGSLIWDRTFSVFQTGPLSSLATEPWVPRDWIPQLTASKLEQWFGLPGVAWLYGVSLITFVLVLYFVSRRWGAPLLAAFGTAVGVVGAYGSTTERPQMVSFILLALFTGVWMRTAQDLRPRWWLVPTTWFWASSHGMWYFGVVMGFVVVAGMMMDRSVSVRRGMRLALVPLLSVAVAAMTPAGPTLLLAAFQTGDKWKFVSEWAPPAFTSPVPAAAMLMVCLTALIWARRSVAMSWVTMGLLLLGTALVLMAARTVAAGAVILVPILVASLQAAIYGQEPPRVERFERVSLAAASMLALVALAFVTPVTSAKPAGVPSGVSPQLEQLPGGTIVLNDYALGGWLHWRHPELNTVIDGFTDGYTVSAMEEYFSATRVEPGWEDYLKDVNASAALLTEDSPLGLALSERLGWEEAGMDGGYVLLLAP